MHLNLSRRSKISIESGGEDQPCNTVNIQLLLSSCNEPHQSKAASANLFTVTQMDSAVSSVLSPHEAVWEQALAPLKREGDTERMILLHGLASAELWTSKKGAAEAAPSNLSQELQNQRRNLIRPLLHNPMPCAFHNPHPSEIRTRLAHPFHRPRILICAPVLRP